MLLYMMYFHTGNPKARIILFITKLKSQDWLKEIYTYVQFI